MSTAQIREEVHNYVNQADSRFIHLVYGMIKADKQSENEEFELSDTHKKILNERLANHQANPDAGSNWKKVKVRIREKL